ncbi:MAG TPA: GNAT family N-acetyltransferase, partial [Pseudonocardiaceae bacterium]|nr:GNAT family N-acetyltransferase [Pseudonocardiaceae bacterium]
MTVTDDKAAHRYELRDGDEVVGFVEYHFYGDEMAFLHTEVKPERGGQGLGSRLIKAALDDARERGLRVLPYCPFV